MDTFSLIGFAVVTAILSCTVRQFNNAAGMNVALSVQRQIDETIETLDILKRKLKTDAAALDVLDTEILLPDFDYSAEVSAAVFD